MARETTKWPSTRWPITKIMSSDGCNGNKVPLEMGPWYDFREFGCHLGNVGFIHDGFVDPFVGPYVKTRVVTAATGRLDGLPAFEVVNKLAYQVLEALWLEVFEVNRIVRSGGLSHGT